MKTKAITHFVIPAIVLALCGFVLADVKHKANLSKLHKPVIRDTSEYFPITLKAFANAKILKARYDSVPWFSHVKGKTYFYVVKGQWNVHWGFSNLNERPRNYKMGLVGPNLKEIIPPGFDLIRDIGGTFPGLVEVEKDGKHGFCNLSGKLIIPVEYDQVFPVDSDNSKAILRKGRDFYWLKNNYTISGKANLNIAQVFGMLKISVPVNAAKDTMGNIIEVNSTKENRSLYLPPSHITDLNLLTYSMFYKKPFRKSAASYIPRQAYNSKQESTPVPPKEAHDNWFKSILYSITERFVFGRTEFYTTKKLIVVDKKRNQVYGKDLYVDYSEPGGFEQRQPYLCNEYNARALNDSLIEVKASVRTEIELYNNDKLLSMPYYHYFVLKKNKIVEFHSNRIFSCTQYVKIDDRYLAGCYAYNLHGDNTNWNPKQTGQLSKEALLYMKNEIYASYYYKFPDEKWNEIFRKNAFFRMLNPGNESRDNVDALLTPIDKYNIRWIDEKLKSTTEKIELASKD